MTQKPIIFNMDYTEVQFVMINLRLTHMLRELEEYDGEDIADLPRSYVIENFYSKKEVWEEFRTLLTYNDTKRLSIHNTFYYPGMYFQKRFPEYYQKPFEERYAVKSAVKTFLLCQMRVSQATNIMIGADISSYILSFLLPEEIGRAIIPTKNNQIQKHSHETVNPCMAGHTYDGPVNCPKCCKLRGEYQRIIFSMKVFEMAMDIPYEEFSELENTYLDSINQKLLEFNLNRIKHQKKFRKMRRRKELRMKAFCNC